MKVCFTVPCELPGATEDKAFRKMVELPFIPQVGMTCLIIANGSHMALKVNDITWCEKLPDEPEEPDIEVVLTNLNGVAAKNFYKKAADDPNWEEGFI
ncbi:MAG TPA: hypothetical protein PKD79_02915 [Candidatus Doudnabacteria bacterium]|nr:hypothetical protein [Candidatus Doudnabacteria bacterium]